MQRTASANRLTNRAATALTRSPSARVIYINEQTNKKSVNTHFHSPFKDGKPNKDYVNPSFISTHLLYPREILKNQQITLRHNYIPQESDVRKEELYRHRINTEANEGKILTELVKQKAKNAKENIQRNAVHSRGPKFIDPEQGLKNQLNILQNYRQNVSQGKGKMPDNSIPPYFQKQRKDNTHETQHLQTMQRSMREFMKNNQRESNLRRESAKRQAQKENQNLQRTIQDNNKKVLQQDSKMRNQSSLLGSILKEQMMLRQQNKV